MTRTKSLILGTLGILFLLRADDARAWEWNSWVRGWVDVITYDGFGPQNPYGNTRLRGWACVNPELYAMGFRQPSTGVVVWQGGPPGQGVLLPTLSVEMEYRWDTVTYGACANPDSGFSIGVNWNQSLPPVFYVQYRGAVGFVMLEGRNTF